MDDTISFKVDQVKYTAKNIPGHPIHFITKDGRVYSTRLKNFLKPGNLAGYNVLSLPDTDKVRHSYKISRLVALAYITNADPEKTQVDHIDRNRLNDNVKNLRWVTPSENVKHAKADPNFKGASKPIVRYSLQGKYIETYKSVKAAGEDMNPENWKAGSRSISRACKKFYKCYDSFWRHEGVKFEFPRNLMHKQVIKTNIVTGETVEFESVVAAADHENLDDSTISSMVKTGRVRKGFSYSFKTMIDPEEFLNSDEWKIIEGYENYAVSKKGEVYSKRLKRCMKLALTDGEREYHIGLTSNGIETTFLVKRLVATAFIPNPRNKPNVKHLDRNFLNNNVDNLRWCNFDDLHTNSISVICYDEDRKNPVIYDSISSAIKQSGVSKHLINKSITKGVVVNGTIWEYS